MGGRPAVEVFSPRSRRAKELQVNPAQLSDDELIALLAREPGLFRRPIIVAGGHLFVGFDRKRLEAELR